MTEKLFYQDSCQREFQAEVLACEKLKEGYGIVLDRTAFFPEGGGQYADTGILECPADKSLPKEQPAAGTAGKIEIEVVDVQEKDGVICHMTKMPIEVGTLVTGRIRWEERFEKMQQHTGEHIVSGIVHRRFGYDNVGFHLGSDYCTMDFNGPITREELKEIEWEANQAVAENLEILVSYPDREELEHMEYRSKIEIEGQVRIVTVPGIDVCACCAPHVSRTGEIGLIKLVNMMNYKGGERITMLCGFRALRDYEKKDENTKAISALLCAKEYEVAEAVEHLKKEQSSLKEKLASLNQKLLEYRAAETSVDAEIVPVFDSELSGNEPRELMNLLLARGAKICAVFAGTDEDGYRYVIGSRTEDVRPFSKLLNTTFSGRGGGKPEMVQGSLKGTKEEIGKLLTPECF